jgi:hypothetical protein
MRIFLTDKALQDWLVEQYIPWYEDAEARIIKTLTERVTLLINTLSNDTQVNLQQFQTETSNWQAKVEAEWRNIRDECRQKLYDAEGWAVTAHRNCQPRVDYTRIKREFMEEFYGGVKKETTNGEV